MYARRDRARPPGESGAVGTLLALGMLAVCGFAALVLDIGHFRVVWGEVQNAADAAALAGAAELVGEPGGVAAARAEAVRFGALNVANGTAVDDLDPNPGNAADGDVVLGDWDWSARAFSPTDDPRRADAVRVRTARTAARGTAVPSWMAQLLGVPWGNVRAEAIGARGSPGCGRGFPLVLAECAILDDDDRVRCDGAPLRIQFSNDHADNGGLSPLTEHGGGVAAMRNLIRNYDPDAPCNTFAGDRIRVQNGNSLNPLRSLMLDPDEDGDPDVPYEVQVPVIRTPEGPCEVRYNRVHEVIGYATFRLEDVTGPPDQRVIGTLSCGRTVRGRPGGGGHFGTFTSPVLVQ